MRNKIEDTSRNTEKCKIASSKDLRFSLFYIFSTLGLSTKMQ